MTELTPFLLKKILSALILPPTSLILLAFVGLWLSRKHPRTGKTITALSLATMLILSLPITGNTLLHSLETTPPISHAQLKDIQAIVILGGGKNNNAPEYGGADTVNRWTLQRLRYGAMLQRQTGKPILVTGGAPDGGIPDAQLMKTILEQEFHAKVRWVEDRSHDTRQNAAYSAAILKQHGVTSIALVTQSWHMRRAAPAFEAQGLRVYPAPIGFNTAPDAWHLNWLPKASALDKSSMALREWFGDLIP